MDFLDMYTNHYDQVLRTARSYLRNNEDAEDATQDTFLEAYESLDSYNDTYAVSTWLNRICANKCRDKLRRRKLEQSVFMPVSESNEHVLDSQEDNVSPEEVLQAEESSQSVLSTFLQLPPNISKAIKLKLVDELSYQQIADELGVPLGTAKTWVRRGRTKLSQAISPE